MNDIFIVYRIPLCLTRRNLGRTRHLTIARWTFWLKQSRFKKGNTFFNDCLELISFFFFLFKYITVVLFLKVRALTSVSRLPRVTQKLDLNCHLDFIKDSA